MARKKTEKQKRKDALRRQRRNAGAQVIRGERLRQVARRMSDNLERETFRLMGGMPVTLAEAADDFNRQPPLTSLLSIAGAIAVPPLKVNGEIVSAFTVARPDVDEATARMHCERLAQASVHSVDYWLLEAERAALNDYPLPWEIGWRAAKIAREFTAWPLSAEELEALPPLAKS